MKNKILLLAISLFISYGVNAQCSKTEQKACCKSKSTSQSTTTTNGGMATVDLKVVGMHCGGCESKVKTVLQNIEGVNEVKTVSATENKATLTYDPKKVSESELVKNLSEKTGYQVSVNTSAGTNCTKGTKTCPNSGKSCPGSKP
jgi:copper chaperone CopZ